MKIKAIHTLPDGSVVIETDVCAIEVKRHTATYSSAHRTPFIPEDGRHTVNIADVPKPTRKNPIPGGIAF